MISRKVLSFSYYSTSSTSSYSNTNNKKHHGGRKRIVYYICYALVIIFVFITQLRILSSHQQLSSSSSTSTTTTTTKNDIIGMNQQQQKSIARNSHDWTGTTTKDDRQKQQQRPPPRVTYDHPLRYPISMLRDISEPWNMYDIPFFWHMPKAAGSTMKQLMRNCFKLKRTQHVQGDHGTLEIINDYINVNTATPEGILEAKKLGLVESNLADVIISSHLHKAATLFNDKQKARMFTLLRHPIEQEVSMFYYLGYAHWERSYNPKLQNMTLLDYATSDLVHNNWLTRFLVNEETKPLNENHVAIAVHILAERCLIGKFDDIEMSIKRFVDYFGWRNDRRCLKCVETILKRKANKHEHEKIKEGSLEWRLLMRQNEYDIQVYESAMALFDIQDKMMLTKLNKGNF